MPQHLGDHGKGHIEAGAHATEVVAKIVEAKVFDLGLLEDAGPGLCERCKWLIWILTWKDPLTGASTVKLMLQDLESWLVEEDDLGTDS